MRDKVYILDRKATLKHYGFPFKVINGISKVDIFEFFTEKGLKVICLSEDGKIKPLRHNWFNRIFHKEDYFQVFDPNEIIAEKSISSYSRIDLSCQSMKSIEKDLSLKYGTFLFLLIDEMTNDVLNMTKNDIYSEVKNTLQNRFSLYLLNHDDEWQTICYFEDDSIWQELVAFIKKRTSKLVVTERMEMFW